MTYKGFSNLAFCFLPCPCTSCDLKKDFVCESYKGGTAAAKAFATAHCGTGCKPIIDTAQYGRAPSTDSEAQTGPIVNNVRVNTFCTCGNAQYCVESDPPPYCTLQDTCTNADNWLIGPWMSRPRFRMPLIPVKPPIHALAPTPFHAPRPIALMDRPPGYPVVITLFGPTTRCHPMATPARASISTWCSPGAVN